MVMPNREEAAKFIYLAQLSAQKGTCQCEACRLLRKCNDAVIDQELNPRPAAAAGATELEISTGHDGRPTVDQAGG